MQETASPGIGNCTISFCNQVYPAYFGGHSADMITRTAMALNDPASLKRVVSNHFAIPENDTIFEATLRHYDHALLTLLSDTDPWSAKPEAQKPRPTIDKMDIENGAKGQMVNHTMMNKQPLASVWGDAIVLVEGFYYWVDINKCDHTTTAQMILDNVRRTFMNLKLGTPEARLKMPVLPKSAVDARRAQLNGNAQVQQAKPPTPPQPAPIPPQQFGSGKTSPVTQTPPQPAPAETGTPKPVSTSESGTPHFLLVPKTKTAKQAFAATYNQQVVSFEMEKITLQYNQKSGQPQHCIWASASDTYPVIYQEAAKIKHEETRTWLQAIQGDTLGKWRVVVFVNQAASGTVYFNVYKIEPKQETVPPELVDQTPAEPIGGTQSDAKATEDTPF